MDLAVFSTSWRWDRGLGHRQLLSQIVEASNVVHAALAHHAGKLSVHLHKTKELKHSNSRTNPTLIHRNLLIKLILNFNQRTIIIGI